MQTNIRTFMRIVEDADFDYGHRDASTLASFNGVDEFGRKGYRYAIKPNDPRFGDNPLKDRSELDEDDEDPMSENDFAEWFEQMPPLARSRGQHALQAITSSDLDPGAKQKLLQVLHMLSTNISGNIDQGNAEEELASAFAFVGGSGYKATSQGRVAIGRLRDFAKAIEATHSGADTTMEPSAKTRSLSPWMQEFVALDGASGSVDKFHSMLNKAGVTDQEIMMRISLSDAGRQKIAARLGMSPHDVDALLGSLEQQLDDNDEADLEESYDVFMEADDLSVEQDRLGNDTIRSEDGDEHFVQGSEATALNRKLARPGADKQKLLRRSMHEADDPSSPSFRDEIKAATGSYNFAWKIAGQHGLATAFYRTDTASPELSINSVRDEDGNDVDLPAEHEQALRDQAMAFIANA